jgi:hypothetical protein
MAATFVDYSIAIGILLIAFATAISFVTGAANAAQDNIQLSTLRLQAISLLGLSEREYAFDTSISGLGLATRITNTSSHPPTESSTISSIAWQRLASKQYLTIREDFDFRIRIVNATGTVASYGQTPPLANVVALQKPALYEASGELMHGTFIVEVW